jgi:hypothetical protein
MQPPAWQPPAPHAVNNPVGGGVGSMASESDIFATLERLADLCNKGVLSRDEYQSKKAELLGRL